MARVTVEIISSEQYRATARAELELGGDVIAASFELDVRDGSELAEKLKGEGGIGRARLARLRDMADKRAQERAILDAQRAHLFALADRLPLLPAAIRREIEPDAETAAALVALQELATVVNAARRTLYARSGEIRPALVVR